MDLTIHISEELYRRVVQIAAEEKRSVDEVLTSAFEHKLVELDRLEQRAKRGSYERFQAVMKKVPGNPPADEDRIE